MYHEKSPTCLMGECGQCLGKGCICNCHSPSETPNKPVSECCGASYQYGEINGLRIFVCDECHKPCTRKSVSEHEPGCKLNSDYSPVCRSSHIHHVGCAGIMKCTCAARKSAHKLPTYRTSEAEEARIADGFTVRREKPREKSVEEIEAGKALADTMDKEMSEIKPPFTCSWQRIKDSIAQPQQKSAASKGLETIDDNELLDLITQELEVHRTWGKKHDCHCNICQPKSSGACQDSRHLTCAYSSCDCFCHSKPPTPSKGESWEDGLKELLREGMEPRDLAHKNLGARILAYISKLLETHGRKEYERGLGDGYMNALPVTKNLIHHARNDQLLEDIAAIEKPSDLRIAKAYDDMEKTFDFGYDTAKKEAIDILTSKLKTNLTK